MRRSPPGGLRPPDPLQPARSRTEGALRSPAHLPDAPGVDRYDLLLFDLDGTLADTAQDVATAMNRTLVWAGLRPLATAQIVHFVGGGVRKLIERCLDALAIPEPPRSRDELFDRFLAEYRTCLLDTTRLYPGVAETLAALRGTTRAVVTNKPEEMSRTILGALGVLGEFEAVVGGDTFPEKKPHPRPIREMLARFQVPAQRALFVGDSLTDFEAARAAGVAICLVTYGYNHGADLGAADYRIDRFDEVAKPAIAGYHTPP